VSSMNFRRSVAPTLPCSHRRPAISGRRHSLTPVSASVRIPLSIGCTFDGKERTMSYVPDPEFRKLYSLFTPDEGSIGERLNGLRARLASDDPLLVRPVLTLLCFQEKTGRRLPKASASVRAGSSN